MSVYQKPSGIQKGGHMPATYKRPMIHVTEANDYHVMTGGKLSLGWYHWHKANLAYVGPFRSYRDAYNAWCVANGRLPVVRKTRRPASPHAADVRQRKALPALDLRHDAPLPDDIRELLDKPY